METFDKEEFVLPDVIDIGLKLLICGSAASRVSAETLNYYAGPGNKFWPTLHVVGLTPTLLKPKDFFTLPEYGIGLTDLAKTYSGSDANLRKSDDDSSSLFEKIELARPCALAFNGKRAAKSFLACNSVSYGRQKRAIAGAVVFVLPSTSPAAIRWWNIRYWHELAEFAAGQ